MDDTLNQTQPQAPVADPAATVPGAVPTPPVGGPVEPQAPVEPTNPAPVADPAATVPGAVPTPPVGGPVEPQAPVEPTNPVVENPVGGQTPPTGQNTPGGIGA